MNTTTADPKVRAAPTIRYRGVPEPVIVDEAAAPVTPDTRPAVLVWLSWGVFAVVVAVWAVVGFLVWVPLLIREMLRFSGALVGATLDGEPPAHAAATLQAAVDFYRRGFVMASDAVHGRIAEPTGRSRPRSRPLARDVTWAVVVWYAVLAVFGVVWSPLEIVRWAWALPWSSWAVGVGAWIVEPFV